MAVKKMCWDYPEFREWFQSENNPGVDPRTIRINDYKTKIIHIHENGYVQKITPGTLFDLNGFYPKCSRFGYYAWDYPQFREWFQPEHNPGIDPTKIRKLDTKTKLYHLYENGALRETTPNSLFTRNSFNFKGYFVCWDYPEFREWFQSEHNPGVDPKKLRRNDTETTLIHVHENGWVQRITPCSLLRTQAWYPEKSRKQNWNDRSSVRMINAIDMDKDIALFLLKAEDKTKALWCMSDEVFEYACPLCGNVFSNEIRKMIGIAPKCPECLDTGFIEECDDALNGVYLSF